jgi:hypothetical protein
MPSVDSRTPRRRHDVAALRLFSLMMRPPIRFVVDGGGRVVLNDYFSRVKDCWLHLKFCSRFRIDAALRHDDLIS